MDTASWEQHTQKIHDKMMITPLLTARYGDSKDNDSDEGKKPTNPWTPELFSLKQRIEKDFGC